MKFSVIIPLYNKAPYITATVESVLAQSFMDFEVIVVDDGSSDGGAELVEAITDPRVRLVRQANAGVSAARNHAISLARGEWVAFLDADDWHHPRYLDTLANVQNAYPQVDTVAAGFMRLPHAEGIWPPCWPVIKNCPNVELITDLPRRWMAGPCFFTSAVTVRTAQLQKMQPCFPLGESCGEDLDLWFRLAEHSPVALARTPLAAYRLETEGCLTSTHKTTIMRPFLQRMQVRALSGDLSARQSRSLLQLVAQFKVSFARQAIVSGNRIEGLRWLLKGHDAVQSKRWWLTAVMALFFPGHFLKEWQLWRMRRTLAQPKRLEGIAVTTRTAYIAAQRLKPLRSIKEVFTEFGI
ncbi:MAG: glycosyltransferase [Polaromonas sp.]